MKVYEVKSRAPDRNGGQRHWMAIVTTACRLRCPRDAAHHILTQTHTLLLAFDGSFPAFSATIPSLLR